MENYESRLEVLVNKIQEMKNKHCLGDRKQEVSVNNGKRYSKVVYNGSVYAFVDKSNGDVLKPASWNAPAKHARGNIFNDDYGFGCCGVYSVAYLK